MPVNIHGKEYKTVAERLEEIGTKLTSVETEVLYTEPAVVIKATIVTDRGTFTGISGADDSKSIEKNNPWEVAETSAVGRALAFAGYAGSEIASADEMQKAFSKVDSKPSEDDVFCQYHNVKMFKTANMKSYAHKDDKRGWCNGAGYKDEKANWNQKVKEESVEDDDISDQVPF